MSFSTRRSLLSKLRGLYGDYGHGPNESDLAQDRMNVPMRLVIVRLTYPFVDMIVVSGVNGLHNPTNYLRQSPEPVILAILRLASFASDAIGRRTE